MPSVGSDCSRCQVSVDRTHLCTTPFKVTDAHEVHSSSSRCEYSLKSALFADRGDCSGAVRHVSGTQPRLPAPTRRGRRAVAAPARGENLVFSAAARRFRPDLVEMPGCAGLHVIWLKQAAAPRLRNVTSTGRATTRVGQ